MMENESSPLQTGVACRAEDARIDAVCAEDARPDDVCADAARPNDAYSDVARLDAENLDAESPDTETPDAVEEEDGALFEHFRFVVDKGQSLMRADKYLSSHMESTSRNRIQLAIDAGYVMANGKVIKSNYKVKPLDILTIAFPYRRHESEIKPENIPLDIVYEDDALLVVNKPAGLVVHPGHGHFSGTLINALAYHLNLGTRPMKQRFGSVTGSSAAANSSAANGSNAEAGNSSAANGSNAEAADNSAAAEEMPEGCRFNRGEADERMGVLVHRIDMNTSGLLVVAKSEYAQIQLAKQFFHHTIERKYVALVWGNMESDSGTIVGNIARDPNDRLRYRVVEDGSGKHAVTHYRVLERFGYVTLVECQLETGRTHQIRVHMNHIGHPLFNDDRYGGDRIRKGTLYTKYKQFIENCFEVMPRHALHAKTLGFEHPITGKHIFLESALPDDFTAVIEKWRKRICTT
ncbi:MAG: RluA family pseudouridine synthase [bacterium]|nr:RluA family pseudouridine synthase [bacterium]MDY2650731.1 RluA family pseudouridine synthase [Candidatus Egerieousia sp.]